MKLVNYWLRNDWGLILYEFLNGGSISHDVLHDMKPAGIGLHLELLKASLIFMRIVSRLLFIVIWNQRTYFWTQSWSLINQNLAFPVSFIKFLLAPLTPPRLWVICPQVWIYRSASMKYWIHVIGCMLLFTNFVIISAVPSHFYLHFYLQSEGSKVTFICL